MVDMVVPRAELNKSIGQLLNLLMNKTVSNADKKKDKGTKKSQKGANDTGSKKQKSSRITKATENKKKVAKAS